MFPLGIELAERGLVPTPLLRSGINSLLAKRLANLRSTDTDDRFTKAAESMPIAIETQKANEQHYELPPDFFQLVLGSNLKYSSGLWTEDVQELSEAEKAMLDLTTKRADIADGMRILELGCGWGSLSLFLAARYPNSEIVAVSNSAPQREFIEARAPANLSVQTANINEFSPPGKFDRVVSVEMFEHMRNHRELLERISSWMNPEAALFVHVFCHRDHSYLYETDGEDNWMGRYFFTGGIMPSFDLLTRFDDLFTLDQRWIVDGSHYQKTAAAWRLNLEKNKKKAMALFREVYGPDATRWYHRWRIFFLSCEELFGYSGGTEWFVGHYRLLPR